MSWNYETSRSRIQRHLDGMGEIEVKKLVREAALETLLTEKCCRQIYGSHIYANVSNFTRLASQEPETEDSYKQLIQAVHIYQREVSRIVEKADLFNGFRVHFQGPKLHALFYRPIDAGEKLSARAVLLQLVLKDFVRSVFNPAFSDYDDFEIAAGADLGHAIGTRNGSRGDREFLFLGAPANHAAKIISTSGRLRLTHRVYDALPEDLQAICTQLEDELYQVNTVSQSNLDALLAEHGIAWNRAESQERVEADQEQFPLSKIQYSSAEVKIKLDELGITNNKRVKAASVYGDVTGFTAYIDAANTEEKQQKALRVFHAIRREMARVIRDDYDGVRIQFQGDRVQGLFHLPKDQEGAISEVATDAAVGLQSSMEKSLKDTLKEADLLDDTEASALGLAAGVDVGATLASKLGSRGHRDRICIGEAVEAAARCEERCEGGETGITSAVYTNLPDRLKQHFSWNATRQCYVATNLTADQVERAAATASQAAAALYITTGASGTNVSSQASEGARRITPARHYGP